MNKAPPAFTPHTGGSVLWHPASTRRSVLGPNTWLGLTPPPTLGQSWDPDQGKVRLKFPVVQLLEESKLFTHRQKSKLSWRAGGGDYWTKCAVQDWSKPGGEQNGEMEWSTFIIEALDTLGPVARLSLTFLERNPHRPSGWFFFFSWELQLSATQQIHILSISRPSITASSPI